MLFRLLRSCLAAFVLLALAAPARAQSDVDTLSLRDGSQVRGHVAEIKPGQSITIVLLTGETRVVPWADFVGATGPSFPASSPPPPPSAQPPPSPPGPSSDGSLDTVVYPEQALLQPGRGRVPVTIESATGKHLSIGVPIGNSTISGYGVSVTANRRLCDAPCTLYVRPGAFTFNSTTADLAYDTDIDVPPRGVKLRMRTPSRGRAFGGVMMLTGGVAMFALGIALIAVAPAAGTDFQGQSNGEDTAFYGAGGALVGVGGGLTIGGIYLLATNRRGIESRDDL